MILLGIDVYKSRAPFTSGGQNYPEGTIIVPSSSVELGFMQNLAKDLHLKIAAVRETPKVETFALKKARIAIYQSWISVEDEGWTRYVLEQYEFPFSVFHVADIRAGALADSYDVIIMPDHCSPELVINGFSKGTRPPVYVGGITPNGLRNLKLFVEDGGSLIFIRLGYPLWKREGYSPRVPCPVSRPASRNF